MKTYLSTTKGSFRRNSRSEKRKRWLLVIFSIVIIGLISPWLISRITSLVLYPFHVTATWVNTSDGVFPNYLRSKADLVAELDALQAKSANETGTKLTLSRLVEENMQLRAMTSIGTSSERIVSRVLARPGQLDYDLLQIDKGSLDGVVVGAPVYTGVDTVVGLVVHVANDYAFVDLFTSPGFTSTAFIFGPNVFSPIEGQGGGVARVKLPQGVPIESGQLVILPGVESGVYGEIVGVQNEPTQPEQYGYITSPVAMSSLLYVSVGKRAIEARSAADIDNDLREQIRQTMRLKGEVMAEVAAAGFATTTIDLATTSPNGTALDM